jgi:hypothetical protein
MPQHIWSVACESSSIDYETQRVSLLNLLESITVFCDSEAPINLPMNFEVVSNWLRTDQNQPEKGIARIYMIHPSGETGPKIDIELDLSANPILRTRVKINVIGLTGPGKYIFNVDIQDTGEGKWKTVADIPLLVEYQKPEPPAA